jgi:hypothetical protein
LRKWRKTEITTGGSGRYLRRRQYAQERGWHFLLDWPVPGVAFVRLGGAVLRALRDFWEFLIVTGARSRWRIFEQAQIAGVAEEPITLFPRGSITVPTSCSC